MNIARAPEIPIRELGFLRNVPRATKGLRGFHVPASRVPFYLQGMGAAAQDLSMVAPIASKITTGALTSSGAIAAGGLAVPIIGAAVVAAITVVASLIAAHEQRLKDAKNENAAAAQAVGSFYQIMQQIVQQYNAGQISLSDAISALQQLDQATLAGLQAHVGTPGTAWKSSQPGVCNKSCTVGCCLYNTYLHPDIYGFGAVKGLLSVLNPNGGSVGIGNIPSNSYGFPAMPATPITVLPAAQLPMTAASLTSSLTGGGSILPLLLLAGGAFLLLR